MTEVRTLPRSSGFLSRGRAWLLVRSRAAAPGTHIAPARDPRETLCGFRVSGRIRVPRPSVETSTCAVCSIRVEDR